LDIAYSLLLADSQWGSRGGHNYRKEANEMLESIWQEEINQKSFSILLSNAVEDDSKDYFDMRTSDFMPAHFKSFEGLKKDDRWKKVIDQNYAMFKALQDQYSPDAGLLPDFVSHIDRDPQPAKARFMESRFDGLYNYNACRIPWRLATDYLLFGDNRSYQILTRINRWLRETTQDNPDNISAGYTLAGDDLKSRHFEALSFIAPFAIAAMIDEKNQSWLNALWNYVVAFKLKDFDYYDNTIKMIDLIILSGNYWAPE
jgi:endo-1,4-beta-D-glucanase Y